MHLNIVQKVNFMLYIYIYIYSTTVRQKEVTLSYDFELGKGFLNINWKHNPKKKKNFW